jgi:transketolase
MKDSKKSLYDKAGAAWYNVHMHEGQSLRQHATTIRKHIITMLAAAGSGHAAGPLGMADIYASLYFGILNHRPEEPLWSERDRLILSCGHTCPVRYAAMAEAGYFHPEDLKSLRKFGSKLQGHPSREDMPSLETSSGPLGQGLSQAIGMAMYAKQTNQNWRTYCILSDGEHQEGQTWEAVMLAGHLGLSNLCAVVDRNHIQIEGITETVLNIEPFGYKYLAHGWNVIHIDGNNFEAIMSAFSEAKECASKPTVIIAETVPGKGVSFIEDDYKWHGKVPSQAEAAEALAELEAGV